MNILIEGGNLNPIAEGTRNIAISYAKKFKEKGHDVVVITKQIDRIREKKYKKFEIIEGVKFYRWFNYSDKFYKLFEKGKKVHKITYNFLKLFNYLAFSLTYKKIMKKEKIDVVQIFLKGLRPKFYYRFIKAFSKKPIILTLLGDPSFNKIIYDPKKSFGGVDLILATSKTINDHLKSLGVQKIRYLPYGVDVEKFKPRKKINGKTKRIYCSRYYENLPALLAALKKLSKKEKFILVFGEGVKRDLTKNEFNDKKLKQIFKKVEYIGYMKNFNEFLSSLDIVIDLHRVNKYLTCASPPAQILESMSSGTIVVSTDIPEIREIIKDGEDGFLAVGNKEKEIYKKIMQALNSKRNIGKNARNKILNKFNLNKSIVEYEKIYKILIKKKIQ